MKKINRGDDTRIKKEIIIHMAGMVAQFELWGRNDPTIKGYIVETCDEDLRRAFDFCLLLSTDGSFYKVKYVECWRIATKLVKSNWRAIRAVAEKLFKDGSVEYSEVVNVIKEQGKDIENKEM